MDHSPDWAIDPALVASVYSKLLGPFSPGCPVEFEFKIYDPFDAEVHYHFSGSVLRAEGKEDGFGCLQVFFVFRNELGEVAASEFFLSFNNEQQVDRELLSCGFDRLASVKEPAQFSLRVERSSRNKGSTERRNIDQRSR